MKHLLMLTCLTIALPAFAGGMHQVPVQLLEMDNLGRIEFLKNALSALGLQNDLTVRYEEMNTIVVGGDERGSDFKGGFFIYDAKLDSSENGFQRFHCHQFLAVGNFEQRLTRPIECKKL